jgi:hypothetical protein
MQMFAGAVNHQIGYMVRSIWQVGTSHFTLKHRDVVQAFPKGTTTSPPLLRVYAYLGRREQQLRGKRIDLHGFWDATNLMSSSSVAARPS